MIFNKINGKRKKLINDKLIKLTKNHKISWIQLIDVYVTEIEYYKIILTPLKYNNYEIRIIKGEEDTILLIYKKYLKGDCNLLKIIRTEQDTENKSKNKILKEILGVLKRLEE